MKQYILDSFTKGWVVGDFTPSLFVNPHVEVAVKKFSKGQIEVSHKQLIATEITIVVSGQIMLGNRIFADNDVIEIPPKEFASFEALSDCALVCIKFPSLSNDKVEE